MDIKLAKNAGFCFGVKKAVNIVNDILDKDKSVATLGPIIHNDTVINELKSKGVDIISDVKNLKKGYTLVIRSHGVTKDIYQNLLNQGVNFKDGTCHFVKKIHNIVEQEYKQKRQIFIIGDKNHAEIIGINAFCDNTAFIFDSIETFKENLNDIDRGAPSSLVVQTTFNTQKFGDILDEIKKYCTNIKIFDTICNETNKKQSEAIEMAKEMDAMIVIGSLHSSNSRKLKDVCSRYTKTYLIQGPDDIDDLDLKTVNNIGITAGASTPDTIIEEVVRVMDNKFNTNDNMEMNFEEALEKYLTPIYRNQIVKGIVTSISPNEVQLDIGKKQTGVIHISELTNDLSLDPNDIVKKGQQIEAMVLKVNDLEGTVILSKKRVDSNLHFDRLEKLYNEGAILSGKVIDFVKGGALVLTDGMKVFVPSSQTGLKKDEDITSLKNKECKFKIIDIDKNKKRCIASIKAVSHIKRKEIEDKFWKEVEVGKKYKGIVKSFTNYGAFVDLGGVNGMIHISEISWDKIKHPSDILKIGDTIEVYIKDIFKEDKKISLGYKKDDDNPILKAKSMFKQGDIVNVKIVSITGFGAFAELIEGVDGLIHISQIDDKKVNRISDFLKVGQQVEAKLIEFDPENKRINLSIRALNENIG